MSREQKKGKQEKGGSDVAVKVVVAVKASKEIPKTALVWALTHVVQPGDCITLLVVVPSHAPGRRLWGFPRFAGDCANGHRKSHSGATSDQRCDITDSCSQMILQLHDVYDPNKINVKIKIVSGSPCGAVSAEAKKAQANWVVLDKQLKHEEKRCMEELQCNIVVMKRSQAKVLRLNLVGTSKEPEVVGPSPSKLNEASEQHSKNKNNSSGSIRGPVVTPTSSPELGTPFTVTEAGTSSVSSDPGASPFFISETNGELKKEEPLVIKENRDLDESSSDTDTEHLSLASSLRFEPWVGELLGSHIQSSRHVEESSQRSNCMAQTSTTEALLEKFSKLDRQTGIGMSNYRTDLDLSVNVREAISLSRNTPPGPPPLCSICQHKAPVFGKPPRWFSYAELELATGGFSQANFLAEGGFGSVHRGVLPDGQAVAVKQHKLASSQGDLEFCSEVEVLSCAQHRNVVMLIGFCIEDRRRLLVYEYICNGSLDSHLYGHHREPLEWSARQKIAVGAARGLRYLHEECRVGCIVHRDMRPNNILITHDFEPLVGDFGLARWQPDGDTGVETRVIGTFGYLAPEYAETGQITEKADVYSFGVVLVELVTGRKAVDLNRPKGQQCLTEWARPLLEEYAIVELIDPQLGNHYSEQEVYCMLHAASICIRRDPHSRPRMSQVNKTFNLKNILACLTIHGSEAALGSPVESSMGSSTETESSDEDDFLAGLTRRLTQQLAVKPEWVMAGSPESTLSGLRSWSVSSNGSPNGVLSPPTTPFGAKNDTWDLIYAAAGEVARLKMSNNEGHKYNSSTNYQRSGLLGPARTQNPGLISVKNQHAGFYPSHCSSTFGHDTSQVNQCQQLVRQEQQALKQQCSSIWERQQVKTSWQAQPRHQHSHHHQIQSRGTSAGNENGRFVRSLGLPQSAWPPLQVHAQNQHSNSAGTRAVFPGGSGVKRECAGTGVFLPRRYSNPLEPKKKSAGCPTVMFPAKVVQALNLNFDDMDFNGLAQPRLNSNAAFPSDYDALMIRRSALVAQQKRNLRQESVLNHEIRLPQEWTY